MNTNFTIKNFRVFDENGVSLELKPITILTGCNSSGKSSIVKAAFLLNSFMKQVNNAISKGEEIALNKYKIDFTSYPNNLLGRFDKVVPHGSSTKTITLEYTIHSCLISKDVNVELVFAEDKNDDLNHAYLVSLSMSTNDGVFYTSDIEKGNSFNLNIIKHELSSYALTSYLVEDLCNSSILTCLDVEEGGITAEEWKTLKENHTLRLKQIGKDRVKDVVKYLRFMKRENDYSFKKTDLELLDWTESNDSFFNIPVLNYLRTIKKEELKSIVDSELISEDEKNTYLSPTSIIQTASDRVINDFVNSNYETFDVYFKDFEHRFFENAAGDNKKNSPNISKIEWNKEYIQSHPKGSKSEIIIPFDEDELQELAREERKSIQQKIEEWMNWPLSFEIIYEVVMLWNEKYVPGDTDYYKGGYVVYSDPDGYEATLPGQFHHLAFDYLKDFTNSLLYEAISSSGFEHMSYVSSSRANVKKLYALDEKNDFTELLKRYFEIKRIFNGKKSSMKPDYKADSFMNKWIKLFEIGESLSFQLDEDGLGVKIYLHKSTDDHGSLLSDEGYGITQLVSILLQTETAILSAKEKTANNNHSLSIFDKYDSSVFHFEENTIAIEEPEIHLHPSFQSKLAEMFVDAYTNYNIHFIIETHSEYLIRKTQVIVAEQGYKTNDEVQEKCPFQTYYVPINKKPYSLGYRKDGKFVNDFGSGFYDEASDLAFKIL